MRAYEINCDECGCFKEGNNLKTICIHCYNSAIKEIIKLRKENEKLKSKLEDKNVL